MVVFVVVVIAIGEVFWVIVDVIAIVRPINVDVLNVRMVATPAVMF